MRQFFTHPAFSTGNPMKEKPSAINIVWFTMILGATLVAAYRGTMGDVTKASFDSAKAAVTLAIGLIGPMALWLGIMKVVEEGGMMRIIARAIRPVMMRLFPDVPAEHPAMSAMIMNMAANMLGLGNAATPMGIKAMHELDTLNTEKGTATNAMCLFLAINTSSVTLLPLGVINVRAGAGAANPSAILLPSLIATACSTTVAILVAKLLARRKSAFAAMPAAPHADAQPEVIEKKKPDLLPPGIFGKAFVWLFILAFLAAIIGRVVRGDMPAPLSPRFLNSFSNWLMPIIMCGLLLFGYFRGVKLYETLTEGAREGFNIAIRIIPFLVAIFVAIGMLRASGTIELLVRVFNRFTMLIGMPAEALTMAILRPLSGSGAFGVMSEIVAREPDSFLSYLVSTMAGSTETTFYVLAVYFGSIAVRRTRHALPAALCADAAGILASVFVCRLMF